MAAEHLMQILKFAVSVAW